MPEACSKLESWKDVADGIVAVGEHVGMVLTELVRVLLPFYCRVLFNLLMTSDCAGSLFTEEATATNFGRILQSNGMLLLHVNLP